MIDPHTLKTLEFDKVITAIEGYCLTVYGHDPVRAIAPTTDRERTRNRLAEISQMMDVIRFEIAFPLYRIDDDCREVLRKSTVEGGFIDPPEMLAVLRLVNDSIRLHEYEPDERDKWPTIDNYLRGLRAFPELRDDINRAIDNDGTVKDNASPALRHIRIELANTRRKIMARLENILSTREKKTGWQDDVVTQRNSRYVIPVPSSRYDSNFGILHDRSQSGATFFVEPQETVEMNNRINLLMQEERMEIDRILRALTAEIGMRSQALIENTRLIGELDRIHASATLGVKIEAHSPQLTEEASVELINSRHPLLIIQLGDVKKVIPTSFTLGDDYQIVLVTGPNTGGKTITLKTIGLSVLMAMAGLPISADEKSRIGDFRQVHADIGDEQSIELSLSTFSSHITNIIHSLDDAGPRTLLLFDEIGAGTDPKEGSALAEAIINFGIEQQARIVATTHYSELKTMAMEHPEIENASLEFNRETLAPTYTLQMGIPGSSYAVEIARRLGMPTSICDRAGEILGESERSLTELIATLQEDLAQIRKDRQELSKRLAKANAQEQFYRMEMERIQKDVDNRKQNSLEETETFLRETRKEIERLVAELRDSQASKESVKKFHHALQKREKELGKVKRKENKQDSSSPGDFQPGDIVTILSLGKTGELEQLIGSDRARVKVGNIATTVELRNLKKEQSDASGKTPGSIPKLVSEDDRISPEIHLRGMTVEEAIESLERYLDRAVLAGLNQVYVVHGKGTGRLRRALTEFLRSHRDVASLRLGDWNEGGAGVTIVKLKE
ncbi:MAG TPA: endonuclease MutS2 [candidate division Zixibacteria bacterium]|nr:endonuclease MutS2 [candidate division Zixibacteria bacterium]